jgi:hypothetical protein
VCMCSGLSSASFTSLMCCGCGPQQACLWPEYFRHTEHAL